MRILRGCILLVLLAAGVLGQSRLTGSCKNGGDYPYCVGGEIVFTGNNFPALVHIVVTNSTGGVIDDGDYVTNGGILSFTENLSFADTYTIVANSQVLLTVATV